MASMETVILKSLTSNIEYTRTVIPYLKKEYFKEKHERALYMISDAFFRKYNSCPSAEVLRIEIEKLRDLDEDSFNDAISSIEEIEKPELAPTNQWLVDSTEEFVKDRALHIALQKAVEIFQGNEKKLTTTAIPSILTKALAVGFDTKAAHDYMSDAEKQLEYYHSSVLRIPFDVDVMNEITNGGIPRRTLTIFIAGTHVGKSLTMCSFAGGMYMKGSKVLYISLEETEEEIRKRIDANLMNIAMDDLLEVNKEVYRKKIKYLEKKSPGILKIRAFPTSTASAGTFHSLLEDLRTKENFVPDIIFVDYMNICVSDRYKNLDNSSTHMKSVAEELRGLTFYNNCALVTAAQLNRTGFKNSDPGMDDAADSFSSLFVGDGVFVISAPEELRARNMVQIKQEKNRFRNLHYKRKFFLGTDPLKMRVYDVEDNSKPIPDIDDDMPEEFKTYDLVDKNTGEVLEENVSVSKTDKFKEFTFNDETI